MPREVGARRFDQLQQLLDYLVALLAELNQLADPDFPSVGRHIEAAHEEARRLKELRG